MFVRGKRVYFLCGLSKVAVFRMSLSIKRGWKKNHTTTFDREPDFIERTSVAEEISETSYSKTGDLDPISGLFEEAQAFV